MTALCDLPDRLFACLALVVKIFSFPLDPNHFYISRRPAPQRGVSQSSRTRGGMRWTQAALLTRALTLRTAKSCGPDASTPASSLRAEAQATETIKPGRARRKPLKPLRAGMPGVPVRPWRLTRVLFILHARLRVRRAPGIPHALCFGGGGLLHNSGA